MKDSLFEDKIKNYWKDKHENYINSSHNYRNFCIYGDFGTGKTRILSTCPKPILIHSFDPGGTKIKPIIDLVNSSDCVVDNSFEGKEESDWKSPSIFNLWEEEKNSLIRMGIFDNIGTYCIDSFTKLSDYCMNQIMFKTQSTASEKRKPVAVGRTPERRDYQIQQFALIDVLNELACLPCHIVVTGHIQRDINEFTNKNETSMLLYGKLASKVPIMFDEKYISCAEEKAGKIEYSLQVKNDGTYKAATRMGDKFDKFERPDIKFLLRKAGLSAEDKPSIFKGE